jgi:hypothetical protein
LHGYRRLYGTTWSWQEGSRDPAVAMALKEQSAMEFLVKNLLDVYVQFEYRVVKVRALLQHVKGLHLDLSLLQIMDSSLNTLTDRTLALIDDWFQVRDVEPCVVELITELLPALRDAVDETMRRLHLYSPSEGPLYVAGNMIIDSGSSVALRHRGVRIPPLPGLVEGRRHFNAQHRVNRFRLGIPVSVAPVGSYYAKRFDFLRRAKLFVNGRFPAFSAPIPPLFYHAL